MEQNYSKYIDHTILKSDTTMETVMRFCSEALEHEFASVCVNPVHVVLVSEILANSGVKTCCVVGFPLGANLIETKLHEAECAIRDGASEIDYVMNIGAMKDRNYTIILEEMKKMVMVTRQNAVVKVIIETSLLTREEIVKACELAKEAKVDYVKNSTGVIGGNAKVEDIALMKRIVGDQVKVKASTGINSYIIAQSLIEAGASRLGTSKGRLILEEEKELKHHNK